MSAVSPPDVTEPTPEDAPTQRANGTSGGPDSAAIDPTELAPAMGLKRIRGWELGLVTALLLALYLPRLGDYALWDPWEGHYGEVARRMLQDHDYVKLKWQNESFRSKPVLTFWLMAGSMKLFGVGQNGGYSGEFVSSLRPQWALRLPFALFGVGGVAFLWYALARLYSRRAAWITAGVLATSPYYFMISRQAITDMTPCALLVGSMALFLLALFDDRPLKPIWKKLNTHHLFLGGFALVTLPQLIDFIVACSHDRWMFTQVRGLPGWAVMSLFLVAFFAVAAWTLVPTRIKAFGWSFPSMPEAKTTRQVYLYWFYLFNGLAILAKGPVAPAVSGLAILFYLAATNDWKKLKEWELARGVAIVLVISLPWHFAMYMKDGPGWVAEYIQQHILGRAFKGVHGDRGTFKYYLDQLGVGFWPWVCLLPAALGSLVSFARPRTREEHIRLIFATWAITSFGFFIFVQTKFHHYILPTIPAFAALVALWLDDALDGKVAVRSALIVAAVVFVFTTLEITARQEDLVALFTYRYDRPWPYAQPWNIDFSQQLTILAGAFGVSMLVLWAKKLRGIAVACMLAAATVFAVFTVDKLLVDASPHWGQRHLHELYYKSRDIHGVDLVYYDKAAFGADWTSGQDLPVRSVIPDTLTVGAPMTITFQLRTQAEEVVAKGELAGTVASIDAAHDRFTISVPAAERQKLEPTLSESRAFHGDGRRVLSVNADRMIAWQLNWRGENFWTGGEIWNALDPDMQTVFIDTDNTKFLEYLRARMGHHRKFWVVTEIGRLDSLKGILPTATAKETFRTPDQSSNKFGLATFTLD